MMKKHMTIIELCKQAHQIAVEKGFWEQITCPKCNGFSVEKYANMKILCSECNSTGKAYKSRNTAELLMLIVSELGEACEALRREDIQGQSFKDGDWRKDSFEDEIADAFIRLGDLCTALNINIEWQINKKIEYNKTRPTKHGKRF